MSERVEPAESTTEDLLAQAEHALELARAAGADDSAVAITRGRGLEFRWRDGQLENVKENASRGLSVALYVDGRFSTHGTNDLDPGRLERFLADAVALTRHLEPDPYRRIPDPKLYEGRADVDLDLVDPAVAELDRDTRLAWCRTMDERARADDAVISSTTHVADDSGVAVRATSNGFRGTVEATTVFYGAQVTIRDGDKRPEDAHFVGGRHRAGLPEADAIGREALRRALARRGSKKTESCRTKMIVHPEAGASLIGRMVGALSAGSVQQKRSFLAGKRDARIASPLLSLRDEPLLPRALGSQLFDGEGIAAKSMPVIENGVIRNYFVDTYYGRKLGWDATTGGASNLILGLGEKDLNGILRDVGDGILVTAWLGGNANLTTGDFSFGIRGHLVRAGEIAEPISEMNITGTYLELLDKLAVVGNDPVPWFTCRTPTLVFDEVEFSGS